MPNQSSVYVLVVLSVIITYSKCGSEENCDKLGTLFYEDIGCEGLRQNSSKCPVKYTCPDLSLSSEKCLYQNRTYSLREQVDISVTFASCNVGCYCRKGDTHASFLCAVLDCPEWLNGPVSLDCYRTYEPEKCCSVGIKCPKTEHVAKCEVDGETYLEGQRFYPNNTCLVCVCTNEFDGSFGKSYCKKRSCGSQLHHSGEIAGKCAPVYLEFGASSEALCCPDQFICPSASDKIERIIPQDSSKSDLKCTYGTHELEYGEGFKAKVESYGPSRDVQCTCLLPPLVQCKEI